ncbi:MAG: glycosyltransferase family 4 protein [Verrucomicrobiaceae bacterium]|nr:glycosyltransferase family 4 protein [Verrucomicrobiaceae bacterium]
MKILQISITSFSESGRGSLYSDLAYALNQAGHSVTVISLDAKVERTTDSYNPYRIIRVKSKQIFNTSKIKKAFSFLFLPKILKNAMKEYLTNESFDLVLFEAPPVTLYPAIRYAMKKFGAESMLMQKDIFPQNAVDLKFFSKWSFPYLMFRFMEKQMLKTATYIGCMSQGNIEFILKHNTFLPKHKVVYFPNTQDATILPLKDRIEFEKKYGIPQDACVFIFSGNMGKPQNLPFIQNAVLKFKDNKKAYFVFIGSGSEAKKIKNFISENNITNARFFERLPREEYEKFAANCDVGIVSLDPRFTIPNYPSKTLSYMNLAQPILAATDLNTDYRLLIETQAKCGVWSNSADNEAFFKNIQYMIDNQQERVQMGENGRNYLIKYFSTKTSVEILENLFASK